jgi:hypothetical protein
MSKVSENDQGFAEWLNRIDAVIGYDRRRQIPLLKWRGLFQSGYPGSAAIQCCFSADELQQALNGTFPFTEKDRVRCGYQCPECSSVRINSRTDVLGHVVTGSWECTECGCRWDRNCYPATN